MFLPAALTLVLSLSAPAHATDGAPATRREAATSDSSSEKKAASHKKNGKGNKSGNEGGNGKKKGKGEKEPPGKIAAGEFKNSARTLKKGAIVLYTGHNDADLDSNASVIWCYSGSESEISPT